MAASFTAVLDRITNSELCLQPLGWRNIADGDDHGTHVVCHAGTTYLPDRPRSFLTELYTKLSRVKWMCESRIFRLFYSFTVLIYAACFRRLSTTGARPDSIAEHIRRPATQNG